MKTPAWLKAHRNKVITHSLIVGGFLLFLGLLAEPLFTLVDRSGSGVVPGEAQRVDVSMPLETGSIRYYIRHTVTDTVVEFLGWAFIEGHGAENTTIHVVLRAEQTLYVFEAVKRDVVTLNRVLGIEQPDLTQAGFVAVLSLAEIEKGTYTVGIHIRKGEVEALQYTNVEIEW